MISYDIPLRIVPREDNVLSIKYDINQLSDYQHRITYLDYIQSTGTQFINSEYRPLTENIKIIIEFEITAGSTGSLFGSEIDQSPKYSIISYGALPSFGFYVGDSSNLLPQAGALNTKYRLEITAKNNILTLKINNGPETSTEYSGSIINNNDITIFTNNIMGDFNTQRSSFKLYLFQIYDNDNLQRDFRPVLDFNNAVCLLDKVNNKFHYNKGTGVFLAGPLTYPNEQEVLLGSSIRSIQRGTYTFTSASNATITIDQVNPNKCHVYIDNGLIGYGGWYWSYYGLPGDWASNSEKASGSDYGPTYGSRVVDLTATTLTLSPNYYNGNSSKTYGSVTYQIIEYT